jgi:survival-of-motor-neuron-related-splicing factor 30
MKKTAEDTIAENDSKLAQLRAQLAELEATLPKKPEPEAPKFDPEKHPLLKKATEKVEPAKPVVFHSGDLCEAQWTDRQWYKVKVQTVLGSASDPKYHVRFLDYKDSTLTVGRDAIRPLLSERKRKSDAPPTPTTAPTVSSGHVISGPASINPQAKAKQNAGVDGDEHRTRRKIGSNKALDRKKSAWEEFKSKGPGKMVTKKQSMFKTGDGPNSRGTYCISSSVKHHANQCSWFYRLRRRNDPSS